MSRHWLARALPVIAISAIGVYTMQAVETPTASLAHTVVAPDVIRLDIEADPDQLVRAKWTLECVRHNGRTARTSQTLTVRTPLQADLPLPVAEPKRCHISADAELVDGEGRLEVVLLKR